MTNFAYFDNAATTFPKLPSVLKATTDFVTQFGVNAGRGQYDVAAIAAKMVKETRGKLLELLHARPEHTVVFTPSATIALNMVLQGQRWKGGETVYISHFEHNAVTRVLHVLKERHNLQIKYLAMAGDSTEYDLDAIKKQFSEAQPNYLICSHASNVCGTIAPIMDICSAAKEYGATTILDMAQSAGLLEISLTRLKVDFCVFAGHKTLLGLVGVGGFICRTGAPLDCILYGGTGLMSKEPTMPKDWPDRYEPGSSNTTAIASLNAAIDYIKGIGRERIEAAEQENKMRLLSLLREYNNIRIVGENKNSVGIVSCIFDGYSPDNIGNVLNDKGVAVRTGLHCAPDAHKFLGTFGAGTVRLSVNSFTTLDDFHKLKAALDIIHQSS